MKTLFAAAALIASLGSAHAVNLVVDGGFEDVKQAPGTWSVYSSINGWSSSGAGIEVRDGVAGNAFEGNNYVELDSYSNSAMAQTLKTVAGSLYNLSFEYSAREGVAAASNPISVAWNGNLLGTAALDGTGQHGNVWHLYSFSVLGTGSDVLQFTATGTSDSFGGSLDAVSVSAVPEPSTPVLMIGGLALIGLSLGRRRNRR